MVGDGDFYEQTGNKLDQTNVNVIADDNTGSPDSMVIGGWFINGNTNLTVIPIDEDFVPFNLDTAITYAEEERFTLSDAATGELTYNGVEQSTISITASLDFITGNSSDKLYHIKGQIDRGDGGVESVAVVTGGINYAVDDVVSLTGVTSGATNATAIILNVDGSGGILNMRIILGGDGYIAGETVNFAAITGIGTGGTGTVTLGFVPLPTPILFPIAVLNKLVPKTITQEVIMNTGDKIRLEIAGIDTTEDITISGTLNATSS